MRNLLLLFIFIPILFSNCRRLATKTETFTDSLEVTIPRDTIIIIEGSKINDNLNIDSLLSLQEGKFFTRYDSLNRAYLRYFRQGKDIFLECNCPDTTARIKYNDRLKIKNTTKTITIERKFVPSWVYMIGGAGGMFLLAMVLTLYFLIRKR